MYCIMIKVINNIQINKKIKDRQSEKQLKPYSITRICNKKLHLMILFPKQFQEKVHLVLFYWSKRKEQNNFMP